MTGPSTTSSGHDNVQHAIRQWRLLAVLCRCLPEGSVKPVVPSLDPFCGQSPSKRHSAENRPRSPRTSQGHTIHGLLVPTAK